MHCQSPVTLPPRHQKAVWQPPNTGQRQAGWEPCPAMLCLSSASVLSVSSKWYKDAAQEGKRACCHHWTSSGLGHCCPLMPPGPAPLSLLRDHQKYCSSSSRGRRAPGHAQDWGRAVAHWSSSAILKDQGTGSPWQKGTEPQRGLDVERAKSASSELHVNSKTLADFISLPLKCRSPTVMFFLFHMYVRFPL